MFKKTLLCNVALFAALVSAGVILAQAPVVNIDHHRHPSLAAAQEHVVQAYQAADQAQAAHKDELGGHAEKAKDLLAKADAELRAAASYADQHGR
ncbi:MAG: hypothetical protein WBS18_03165 [Candidatus Acidiferrales bacterium]